MWRLVAALCFAFVMFMLVSYDGERWTVSYGRLPVAVCCLVGLYFTMAYREGIGGDSFEHILVRKQIHAMNWRFVSNKAIALLAMRQVLRYKRPRKRASAHAENPDIQCYHCGRSIKERINNIRTA